jgi:S-(hydroxymethyl)glutathione dehydrogenase/alcohol dehydrogenase
VITCLSAFCGECEYCLSGHMSLCSAETLVRPADAKPRLSIGGQTCHQFLHLSSFAEQMLVHEHAVV